MTRYPTAALARKGEKQASPWFRSLDGVWKFNYAASPAARPAGFEQRWFDDRAWADIRVPGNWEIQGFGIPIYSNSRYPFAYDRRNPRAQRNDNPVGSYRTRFEVPAEWAGRRVLLHFAGVDSAFYVWVNGVRVGYNEDSRTPAEFDITPHVVKGPNVLAVEVYRWSDGSYLEDQDMFRLSGIFRDVYLWSTDPRHVRDFEHRTDFDAAGRDATLRTTVNVSNRGTAAAATTVSLQLLDAAGKEAGRPVSREVRAPACRGAAGRPRAARPRASALVGRDAVSLHRAPDAHRLGGPRARSDSLARGVPNRGDPGRAVARQRPGDSREGRQPPRAQPRLRPLRRAGVDGARHRVDEAEQRQRRANRALPERSRVVRPVRRVRPLRDGRGQHREPRLRPRPG